MRCLTMGEFLSSINETVNPAHTAVVVVDMQNDFCAENGYMHKHLGVDMSSNFHWLNASWV